MSATCFGQQTFRICSAAFPNCQQIADQYIDKGRCTIPPTATSEFTLRTVTLSTTVTKAVDKIPFRVAIRDKATKTVVLPTKNKVKQIDVRNVRSKCRKDDRIVLLTPDDQYALPHNEILVN
ncbi:hypothetical protein GK091_20320 [Spirosoma agri]|uniref:Uncharacterized protein n=1 Tax=Spirosoma agri TaxID=1987381 RepID=A0A6M0IM56_9BACT|nr:hypothetical protein [Spirosoma agri]